MSAEFQGIVSTFLIVDVMLGQEFLHPIITETIKENNNSWQLMSTHVSSLVHSMISEPLLAQNKIV